jgi:hypothetical protein
MARVESASAVTVANAPEVFLVKGSGMRKRPNPDSEANIRRIDTKRKAKKQTHGFQVHLLRGEQAITKLFSDNAYGGKEGARRAARKFKRTALADLPDRSQGGLSSDRRSASPVKVRRSRAG